MITSSLSYKHEGPRMATLTTFVITVLNKQTFPYVYVKNILLIILTNYLCMIMTPTGVKEFSTILVVLLYKLPCHTYHV